MTQWHFYLQSAALEKSYYIQDSNLNRALEAAKWEFNLDHQALGVVPMSCLVVLQEQTEI